MTLLNKKLSDMKRLLLFCAVAVLSLCGYGQSMKMVVDKHGNVVGRYVETKGSSYVVEVQDTYEVSRAGKKVVTFSAAAGQGVVYRNQARTGNINVRKGPSTSAAVVAKIPEFDGVPDTYPCLGKVNGWYKIRIHGKVGYVRADMAEWDGMDTF